VRADERVADEVIKREAEIATVSLRSKLWLCPRYASSRSLATTVRTTIYKYARYQS